MLNPAAISSALEKEFPYSPTAGQRQLIKELSAFICSDEENALYIARGYAGTGKTTLISALVKVLPRFGTESLLMAPTGRAAKVLAAYSGKQAYTIHRKIYHVRSGNDNILRLSLQKNHHRNAIIIVDEASMIYDSGNNDTDIFSGVNLLNDLITYAGSGYKCRMVFIGDNAQLPPVGLSESPALDINFLSSSFNLKIQSIELTEVVRQNEDSGILRNATIIRELIRKNNTTPPFFETAGYNDIKAIGGADLEDALHSAYSGAGRDGTLVICKSNKRANIYNREIRSRILGYDNEINTGDLIMSVRNNYFWLSPNSKPGFIANGDIMEILRVRKTTELYGFRFADVQVRMLDYPDEPDLDVKIMLDTLTLDTPALPWKDNQRFFEEVMKDYMDIPAKYERMKRIKCNPYFNALQVKFAYALTCHKSQGGQWEQVFLDQGYLTDDMIDKEYLRWLYTAITRATVKLHLINFNPKFFFETL